MTRNTRLLLVLVMALLLQVVVVDPLAIAGVRLDLWIVLTVAGGLAAGPERGATIGFLCGMAFDLTQNGPIGLAALLYCVSGYLVGSVQRSVVGPARWVPTLAATVTTLAAVTAYVILGVVLGETAWLTPRVVPVILIVAAGAAVLTPPAVRIMAWTEGEPLRRPGPPSRSKTGGRSGRVGPLRRASLTPSRSRGRR